MFGFYPDIRGDQLLGQPVLLADTSCTCPTLKNLLLLPLNTGTQLEMDNDIETGIRRIIRPPEVSRALKHGAPSKDGNPELCSKCQALFSFQKTDYVTSEEYHTRKVRIKEQLEETKGNGCPLCAILLHSMGITARQELLAKQCKDLEF